jgi:hypothetical protein
VYTALLVIQCMNKCCAVIDTIWLESARFSDLGKISFGALLTQHYFDLDVVRLFSIQRPHCCDW